MWWVYALVIVGLVLWGLIKRLGSTTDFWPSRGVKIFPKSETGSLFERITLKHPIQEYDAILYRKMKAEGLPFGGTEEFRSPVFMPVDLDLVKRILIKDFDYFVNRRVFESQRNDKFFKDMMTVKENQEWKDLRSTLTPTFTTGKIKRMFDIFNECSTKLVDLINSSTSPANRELEIMDGMSRYVMDVIAWSAFGVDSQVFKNKDSVFSAMGKRFEANFQGIKGIIRVGLVLVFPKIGGWLRISLAEKTSAEFFTDVIRKTKAHREKTGERRQDFLQLIMDAQAGQLKSEPTEELGEDQFEKDAKLSQEKTNKTIITDGILVSQSLLFFLAGFSTTQTLLIFAAYELALNPDVQEKLAKEIKNALKLNDGKLSYDLINDLQYLDQVIFETLRKYPPGVRTERKATSDYQIPGSKVVIPKDTTVLIPVWAIHRDPEYYPDPEKFIPERFTAENKAKRHSCAYLPFGAGPRNCIAMRFALMEGKVAIAKLVENFILEPSPNTPIPIKHGKAFLNPDGGIHLNFKPRNTTIKAMPEE